MTKDNTSREQRARELLDEAQRKCDHAYHLDTSPAEARPALGKACLILSEARSLIAYSASLTSPKEGVEEIRRQAFEEAAAYVEAQAKSSRDLYDMISVQSDLPVSEPTFSCAGLDQIADAIRDRGLKPLVETPCAAPSRSDESPGAEGNRPALVEAVRPDVGEIERQAFVEEARAAIRNGPVRIYDGPAATAYLNGRDDAEHALITLSAKRRVAGEIDILRDAIAQLNGAVRFTAFSESDPLAIRFEFIGPVERMDAANALDEAFAALTSSSEGQPV